MKKIDYEDFSRKNFTKDTTVKPIELSEEFYDMFDYLLRRSVLLQLQRKKHYMENNKPIYNEEMLALIKKLFALFGAESVPITSMSTKVIYLYSYFVIVLL